MTTRLARRIYEGAKPVPKGKCKKCGEVHYGWALVAEDCQPEGRTCDKCGGEIELIEPDEVEDLADL